MVLHSHVKKCKNMSLGGEGGLGGFQTLKTFVLWDAPQLINMNHNK